MRERRVKEKVVDEKREEREEKKMWCKQLLVTSCS